MKIRSICFASVIVLSCPYVSGQWVRTNGLDHDYVVALTASGRNLLASITNCQGLCIATTYFSTDAGTTWNWISPSLKYRMASAFAAIGTSLFAGTAGDGVFISTNNGVSWIPVDSGLGLKYVNCFVVSGANLFAGTDQGPGVFLSTNNGTSWTEADAGLTDAIRSLVVIKTCLFAGTGGSGVFLSTNNGTSWAQVDSGLNHRNIWSLAVVDTNLYAVTDSGGFLSTNFGTTWTPFDSGLVSMIVLCLGDSGRNVIKSIDSRSSRSGIFSSTDNGTSWTEVDSGLSGFVTCLAADATNVYAGTNDGVWLRPLSELFASVQSSSGQMPTVFELCQNYPNPFNPSTTIRFTLPQRSQVTLTVFNTLGQHVATLVNGEEQAGNHEIKFDGSGLASGVYFYRLQAGNFVATKKLLLLR